MRKHIFFIMVAVFLSLGCGQLFAQLASDPNDRLYTDLKLWEDRGLLQNLPPLEPYPIQLLKKLLGDVQDKGDDRDRALAAAYLNEMSDLIDFRGVGGAVSRTDLKDVYGQFTLGGTLQGSILPWLTYSGSLAAVVNNGAGDALLPGGPAEHPGLHLRRRREAARHDGLHTPRVVGLLGCVRFRHVLLPGRRHPRFVRALLGDNAILSPTAPQAGQISYVFRHEYFTVTEMIMSLSAVSSNGTGGPFPNKFMSLHSLELYPLPWLTFSVFESIVWGGRFELLYTLPFAVYYYAQGFGGFSDNSFIGLSGGIKFPSNVRADIVLYVDDAAFNDLIKLNFNTMIEVAVKAGVAWTPNLPWLTRLSLNALAVTPYTYTHTTPNESTPGEPNYLNYTNSGQKHWSVAPA